MSKPAQQQLQMLWPEDRLHAPPAAAPPAGYRLRRFEPGDTEGYVRLMAAAGFADFTPERVRHYATTALPDGFLLAVHGGTGEPAATAMATHSPLPLHPSGGELAWVAASPQHRGRGLGLAVCAAATRRFLEMGYRRVYLKTDDWRLPALKTYLKLGYRPYLFAAGMESRWAAICQKLGWPFTPQAWPKLTQGDT